MTDELDPAERRLARQLADFADTPVPGRDSLDLVAARAAAGGRASASRTRLGALLAAAIVVAVAIGGMARLGLGPFAAALPSTAAPSASATPAATSAGMGILHLVKDPEYDSNAALQLRYILADGSIAPVSDTVDANTIISLDRSLPAGPIRIMANEEECAGTITIEANVEVDAVLRDLDEPCSVSVTATHGIGAIVHPPPRTALGAFVVVDSVLVVRPLDAGSTMQPLRRPADERAEVVDFDIAPGRYALDLEVGGAVLNTLEIDLKLGQGFYYDLRVLDPAVPRDCGAVPATECQAAVAEAYAQPQGAGTPATQHVLSVRVRPSRYSGGCQPFEPPLYDVSFDVREESRTIEITLGAQPDGRLYYCTY